MARAGLRSRVQTLAQITTNCLGWTRRRLELFGLWELFITIPNNGHLSSESFPKLASAIMLELNFGEPRGIEAALTKLLIKANQSMRAMNPN